MKCAFVDDEINLLNAFKRQLEGEFLIETFSSPEKALHSIALDPEIAVVVTDYRMPNMNGVDFLKALHLKSPDVVPILLTGFTDVKTAAEAVNDGRVFRFMTKPCSPAQLTKALTEALAYFQQEKRERELLEQTLSGSVKILTDIMGIIDPLGFEQGKAIRQDLRAIARTIGGIVLWETELAAMLLDLGSLVLPTAVLVRSRTGQDLTPEEQKLWMRVPEVGANLIKQVPRLAGGGRNYTSAPGNVLSWHQHSIKSDPKGSPTH